MYFNENAEADRLEIVGDALEGLWAEVNAIEYGEAPAVETATILVIEDEDLPF